MKNLECRVTQFLDEHQQALFQMLSELIQIESVNYMSHGDEIRCADYIAKQYRKLGLTPELYYPDAVAGVLESPGYLPGRGTDKRPNLCAVWHAPDATKKVVLASHTDTMPIGGRDLWTVEPLAGEIKDGRVYGRGANDNKFGIASTLMAVRALQACGVELDCDVVLEAYCDEEYGGGNGALAAGIKHRADAIINTDGGNYEIWSCSMGGQGQTIRVCAQASQDSAELVVSALNAVWEELQPFIANRYEELDKDPYFHGTDMQRSAVRLHEFRAGDNACDLDFGNLNFVYYSNQPQERLTRELDEAQTRIRARLAAMQVTTDGFRPTTRFFYCLSLPDENEMLQILKAAAEDAAGHRVKISGACLSDLSLFLKFGSPVSVNFGIIRDFKLYGGAHRPDEFVTQTEFLHHCKALALFLIRWGGVRGAEQLKRGTVT